MDLNKFKNKVLESAKDCEIYFERSNALEIHILNQEVREFKNADTMGLSFRGMFNNAMGYSYTEKISDDIIPMLIKQAKENAAIKEGIIEPIHKGSPAYPKVDEPSTELEKPSPKELIALAKEVEAVALEKDLRVAAVDYCAIGRTIDTVSLANSYNLNLSHKEGSAFAYAGVRVQDKNNTKMGFHVWFDRDFTDFDPKILARIAVEKALSKLNAIVPKSGKYNIVLDNKTAVSLLEIYTATFFGESVQKGFSLLKGKVGEKIAAPMVTLRDNINHPLCVSATPFDAEGVAVRNKILIDKGVLKSFLYNLKSAAESNTESTGNGFKMFFKSPVTTDVCNFYIEPGPDSREDILKKLDKGLLITDLQGLHAGANPISGDFSIQSEGFFVEKGQISGAREQFVLSGNFFQLLKNIEALGSDLLFADGGTIGSPSMLIKDMEIGGA